jgi:nucleotidyltransferase substrate binding protein (TIGR01987 family)
MDDIRWKQRFSNYQKALQRLNEAVVLSRSRELSYLEKQGFIQAFEFTFELSWKVMKDFLEYKGVDQPLYGSRDAIKKAFSLGIIHDGETWMKMIKSRNLTSHIYDEKVIDEIISAIEKTYMERFSQLYDLLAKEL